MNPFRRNKLALRVQELEWEKQRVRDVLSTLCDRLAVHRDLLTEDDARYKRLLDHLGLVEHTTPQTTQLVKKGGPERSDG